MAKIQIIWSNRAKKRLYGILEYYIGRDKNKDFSISFQRQLNEEVKLLLKYPETGLKTTEDPIRGLKINDCIVYYEIIPEKIIIHTIWDSGQIHYRKTIKY